MNTPPLAAVAAKAKLDPATLEQAFEALKTYERGSGRAALLPLDTAVAAVQNDPPARQTLEQQFLAALKACSSELAREFICSKLAWIGSTNSVATLAALLPDPQLSCAACSALQAIPDNHAAKALRDSLPKLNSLPKVGVINSLGARRDADSVRVLVRLLKENDTAVASAATAALGRIGSVKAAKALRAFQPKAPPTLQLQLADAALACAEQLLNQGRKTEAQALYQMLAAPTQPAHVQSAASRGLHACSAKG